MTPFTIVTGTAAPLPRDHVNTDILIPVDWMRSLSADLASGLFASWRYRPDGTPDPSFVLNQPEYQGATILVTGRNFGCGSSRENAVWALAGYGIRCVIAVSFAEIFVQNAFRNGLLVVSLSEAQVASLLSVLGEGRDTALCVDLEARRITHSGGWQADFAISDRRRAALLAGKDELEAILEMEPEIAAFEERDVAARPWIYLPPAEPG